MRFSVVRIRYDTLPLMRAATLQDPVSVEEIRHMAEGRFGDMVKAVVDLERGIVLLDAEMHADQEAELLAGGSVQQDLWGDQPVSRFAGA
jgi:hypothetical protein